MNAGHSIQNLSRTAGILALLLLIYTAAVTWYSWTDGKAESVRDMATIAELEATAVDRYFSHLEIDLKSLGENLTQTGSRIELHQAYALVKRFKELHNELFNVTLIQPDGEVLLTAKNPPGTIRASLAKEGSFIKFIGELNQGKVFGIGQPLVALVSKVVIVPVRYGVRDRQGNLSYIVSANLPHEYLRSFWMDAPITGKAAIGLMHENGFLLSRYPVPANLTPEEIYGRPRTGALINYLQEKGFPERGHVQGPSSLDGPDFLNAFRRLPNYPVTLFIAMPMSEIRASWWKRVSGTYLALISLLIGGLVTYRYTVNRQNVENTERKRSERVLQDSRYRLARAETIAHVGNWSYEVVDQAIEWSDGLWDIFGRKPHSAELTYEAFMSWIRDDFRAFHHGKMSQMLALRPGETVEDFIYCLVRPDGEERWVEVFLDTEFDEGGKPLRFFGVAADITESKKAEAERAELEARLRESQKMDALGTLAGGVAHDFNNSLAMIVGNVELARQDVGPGHPALESLEEIAKASRRSKDLVQQILAFSRRQKIERKPTTLSLVVLESARLLRASLPAKVSLNVDCKTDAPAVLADPGQVKQILLNLCGNATHAVEAQERPGMIEVRLEACTVDEARGDLRPGRYACLMVRDNGLGMDEVVRSRLFEPFFTTKPVGQGTGLGLSVVHGIAQAHEASIEVDSTLGEGTTFRIYFPAIEAPVLDVLVPIPSTTPDQGKGKHILYVDDEEGLILLMKRLLTRQGYRFSGYTDPREALAAVRANPDQFDLVVTDYNMPYLSGLELAQALGEIRADLPVVLASGYITEELRAKAPVAGIRELIYKPNTADDLCEAVARYANAQDGKDKSS